MAAETDNEQPADEHEAFQADFSDYHDKTLAKGRVAELEAHVAACERCRIELGRFRDTMGALADLKKVSAPTRFDDKVAETIHRRSAGRFFGRKAFGDRVPFEVLAVLGLVLIIVVVVLLRWSSTGSMHEPLRTGPAPTRPK